MKILNHPAVIALGAATLFLLPLIAPLVSPSHIGIYHLSGSAAAVYLPVTLNVCALWILITGLLWFAERPGWPRVTIWSIIILFLPWILLKRFSALTQSPLPHRISLTVFLVCLTALAALPVLWRPSFQPIFESARSFVAMLFVFTSLSGAFFCGQLLWFSWQARTLNEPRPLHQPQFASSGHPPRQRVIWILLDELSYQQVYEQRFPGLLLPAFDQLASQSTVFTHVIPAGIFTHNVIPSLMSGLPIDQIRSTAEGQLRIHNAASNVWQPFDPNNTVFQDALNDGYSTAIAGWYNPYCRIMPGVLDHCFWTCHPRFSGTLIAERSFTDNALQPARSFVSLARSFLFTRRSTPMIETLDAQLHIADYKELFAAADTLLTDPSANFVFLHMPIPHPGGIYNRQTSALVTSNASYVDNLVLADNYLAHVRQILQQQGQWDSATIIVMGDHSWRTKLIWAPSSIWTTEDQAASHGGQFDDRPAYIVKMPQQQLPVHIDAPFAAIHTRALLDGILSNRIRSSSDVTVWAKQQGSAIAAALPK